MQLLTNLYHGYFNDACMTGQTMFDYDNFSINIPEVYCMLEIKKPGSIHLGLGCKLHFQCIIVPSNFSIQESSLFWYSISLPICIILAENCLIKCRQTCNLKDYILNWRVMNLNEWNVYHPSTKKSKIAASIRNVKCLSVLINLQWFDQFYVHQFF